MVKPFFETAAGFYAARQLHQAIEHFDLAEAAGHHPDSCASARWNCWMLLGNYEQAWCESDAIERRGAPDPHRFWDRTPLDHSRLIVRCLRGLGDSIQCARFLPLLRPRLEKLYVEAPPSLVALFQQIPEIDNVLTWSNEPPAWNKQIEITEFPRYFRTSIDTIPASVPYLTVPPEFVTAAAQRITGPRPRVGLVWEGSNWNPARALPLHDLAPVLGCREINFFSLQRGEARAQLANVDHPNLTDVSLFSETVLETAADILQLDLVITVDTMAAHLAGALGKSVWTLLPFEGDWHWVGDRDDSPWYPTMRLFRQTRPADWAGPVERVAHELRRQFKIG